MQFIIFIFANKFEKKDKLGSLCGKLKIDVIRDVVGK